MSFWDNLSSGTKTTVVIGVLLAIVVTIVRLQEPSKDAPVPPRGIPRPAAPTSAP